MAKSTCLQYLCNHSMLVLFAVWLSCGVAFFQIAHLAALPKVKVSAPRLELMPSAFLVAPMTANSFVNYSSATNCSTVTPAPRISARRVPVEFSMIGNRQMAPIGAIVNHVTALLVVEDEAEFLKDAGGFPA